MGENQHEDDGVEGRKVEVVEGDGERRREWIAVEDRQGRKQSQNIGERDYQSSGRVGVESSHRSDWQSKEMGSGKRHTATGGVMNTAGKKWTGCLEAREDGRSGRNSCTKVSSRPKGSKNTNVATSHLVCKDIEATGWLKRMSQMIDLRFLRQRL